MVDNKLSDEVLTRVLHPIFDSASETDRYLRQVKSSIAGNREWVVIQGGCHSGKGILTELNLNAWGPYVKLVDANKFLEGRGTPPSLGEIPPRMLVTHELDVQNESSVFNMSSINDAPASIFMYLNRAAKGYCKAKFVLPNRFVAASELGESHKKLEDSGMRSYCKRDDVLDAYISLVLNSGPTTSM